MSISFCALALSAHTVLIQDMQFVPAELSVTMDHSVTWINKDLVPHTITAVNKSFDSKTIEPGKSWTFHPKKKGHFAYKCDFHPLMIGSVIFK